MFNRRLRLYVSRKSNWCWFVGGAGLPRLSSARNDFLWTRTAHQISSSPLYPHRVRRVCVAPRESNESIRFRVCVRLLIRPRVTHLSCDPSPHLFWIYPAFVAVTASRYIEKRLHLVRLFTLFGGLHLLTFFNGRVAHNRRTCESSPKTE